MLQNRQTDALCGDYAKVCGAKFTPADFRETLDGGQAFTWFETPSSTQEIPEFEGVFGNTAARLKLSNGEVYAAKLAANGASQKRGEAFLADIGKYLDLDTDYNAIRAEIAASGDAKMVSALKIRPSLRILRQNPEEAIICFICSSSKRIVQIKQCVGLLSEKFGERIAGTDTFHTLPTLERLAEESERSIAECKVGFRARYLSQTAKKIVADKFDPKSLRDMPYAEAKKYLTSLSGIGDKVADCILLFGASRFEAFPVDTWIRQAMTRLYNTPQNPDKIREFASAKFGKNAGYAQQVLFSAIRGNLI